jgi:hypothetical protein
MTTRKARLTESLQAYATAPNRPTSTIVSSAPTGLIFDIFACAATLFAGDISSAAVFILLWQAYSTLTSDSLDSYFTVAPEYSAEPLGALAQAIDPDKVRALAQLKLGDLSRNQQVLLDAAAASETTGSITVAGQSVGRLLVLNPITPVITYGGVPIALCGGLPVAEIVTSFQPGAIGVLTTLAVTHRTKALSPTAISNLFAYLSVGAKKISGRPFVPSVEFWAGIFPTLTEAPGISQAMVSCAWTEHHTSISSAGSLIVRALDALGPVGSHVFTTGEVNAARAQMGSKHDANLAAAVPLSAIGKAKAVLDALSIAPDSWPSGEKALLAMAPSLVTTITSVAKAYSRIVTQTSKFDTATTVAGLIAQIDAVMNPLIAPVPVDVAPLAPVPP